MYVTHAPMSYDLGRWQVRLAGVSASDLHLVEAINDCLTMWSKLGQPRSNSYVGPVPQQLSIEELIEYSNPYERDRMRSLLCE